LIKPRNFCGFTTFFIEEIFLWDRPNNYFRGGENYEPLFPVSVEEFEKTFGPSNFLIKAYH